jgi:large subunit ribosomal protein L18
MSRLRRRRQGLTDYRKRKRFLQSRMPRLVCRISNRYVSAAIVRVAEKGDVTLVSATSKELGKLGWRYGLASVPASYLTGCLLAKKAAGLNVGEVALDIGLYTPTRGNRLFALAKACSDSGLKVTIDESVAPSEDRIRGEHIVKLSEHQLGSRVFSRIRASGADIRSMPEEFNALVAKIREGGVSERV